MWIVVALGAAPALGGDLAQGSFRRGRVAKNQVANPLRGSSSRSDGQLERRNADSNIRTIAAIEDDSESETPDDLDQESQSENTRPSQRMRRMTDDLRSRFEPATESPQRLDTWTPNRLDRPAVQPFGSHADEGGLLSDSMQRGQPNDPYCPDPGPEEFEEPSELRFFRRLSRPLFGSNDPNDPMRHWGIGEPLVGTSWRNRPFYIDAFAGGLLGDELRKNSIVEGSGFFAGARLGYDFDHYWGSELRVGFADTGVSYLSPNARPRDSKVSNSYFDVNLLYYPLGDSRWRPFFLVGTGYGNFVFSNEVGKSVRAGAFSIPLGGGVKYLFSRNFAIRFDVTDNLTFDGGSLVDSMHNVSFTGALEWRFGGRTVLYDPW